MGIHLFFDPSVQKFIIKTPSDLKRSSLTTILEITLGFSNIGPNKYALEVGRLSRSELFDVIRNVIDLFVSEKLEYVSDKEITNLIEKASDDLKKREVVRTAAKKLLKKRLKE